MISTLYRASLVAIVFAAIAACSAEDRGSTAQTQSQGAISTTGPVTTRIDMSNTDKLQAEEVTQQFTEAANSGDASAVANTFAENARFDSVGRIYPSRDAIMNRFLIPEVINVGGRYEVTGTRWNGDRYVVDYRFSTRGGGSEVFYYEFLVRDKLIQDVIGRYS